jgi:hypothetical protein
MENALMPRYSVEDCTSIHFWLLRELCRFCVRQVKATFKHLLMFFSDVKFAILCNLRYRSGLVEREKCGSPLMDGIKDGCQQIVGGNDNLMPLELSLDEAPTTTKPTNALCLGKVSYQRRDR